MRAMEIAFPGLFVTATDTGAGKTYVGSRLLFRLRQAGVELHPRKPVESGCRVDESGRLTPADGLALARAIDREDWLDIITPLRFAAPLAPDLAAREAGERLHLDQLLAACQAPGPMLVEGAGGLLSPIAEDALNADLAVALGLPVLVVAPNRLGCINHVLLTLEALERRGLRPISVVLSRTTEQGDASQPHNAAALRARIDAPVFDLPWQDDGRGLQPLVDTLADLIRAG